LSAPDPQVSFIPLGTLHDKASRWFDRAHAAVLGALPCRRGCSRCCIGPFAITILDVAELRKGLASLAPSVARDIVARARSQAATIQASYPRLGASPYLDGWSDSEQDQLAEQFADLPCPALGADGSCRVYAFRPVTCRAMGIPVEEDGFVEGACEVQTAVPIVRVPEALREEEDHLVEQEASELDALRYATRVAGDEVLITFGFLTDRVPVA
jgi:Fe-S-cluster containining protein